MIRSLLLGFLTIALALAVYLVFHLGVFKGVQVAEETRGPLIVLFKQHTGPYHKILPVLQDAENWASSHGLRCPQTFGEYLDDPRTMDEDRLRSHGGCVLAAPLATAPPEFQYQVRPERKYIVGQFHGSPAIGPYKVYPRMQQYLEEHRLKSTSPMIELYTVHGNELTTESLMAIDGVQGPNSQNPQIQKR